MSGLLGNLLDISDHDRYEYLNSLNDGTNSDVDRKRYDYRTSRSLDNSIDTVANDVREATINEIFDRIVLLWDLSLLGDKHYGMVAMAIYEMLHDVNNWNPAKSHKFIDWTRGNIPNNKGEYKSLDDNKIWETLLSLRSKHVAEFQVQTNQMSLNFDLVVTDED